MWFLLYVCLYITIVSFTDFKHVRNPLQVRLTCKTSAGTSLSRRSQNCKSNDSRDCWKL